MPTTPVYDVPYPGPGDPPNVPADIYALAARMEAILDEIGAATLTSGVYTPTLTATTNVASSIAHPTLWTRVGDVVSCDGLLEVTPSTAAGMSLGISLPVASDLTNDYDLAGIGVGQSNTTYSTAAHLVNAATPQNRAQLNYRAIAGETVEAKSVRFHFAYKVI